MIFDAYISVEYRSIVRTGRENVFVPSETSDWKVEETEYGRNGEEV
jgi:hypothetical protein